MNYLALCLLCVVGIELFFLLPVLKPVQGLLAVSRKSVRVISSPKISDHWKEKVLQRYARDMAVASLKIALGLAILFAILGVVSLLIDALLQQEVSTLEYGATGEGLLLATLFSVLYLYLRKRLVSS